MKQRTLETQISCNKSYYLRLDTNWPHGESLSVPENGQRRELSHQRSQFTTKTVWNTRILSAVMSRSCKWDKLRKLQVSCPVQAKSSSNITLRNTELSEAHVIHGYLLIIHFRVKSVSAQINRWMKEMVHISGKNYHRHFNRIQRLFTFLLLKLFTCVNL